MQDFNEIVAVITGAASSIGKALAEIVFEGIRQRRFWIFTHPFTHYYAEKTAAIIRGDYPVYEQVAFDEFSDATGE